MAAATKYLALTGGSYSARGLIAGAQRCVNLYAERNEQGAPAPYTYFPRPGLRFISEPPVAAFNFGSRGMYTASNGQLYEVVDTTVYATASNGVRTNLGTINVGLNTVFMADNGIVMVIVDGSVNGWVVDLGTNGFTAIADAAFYGADRVAYLDGFLIFNRPGTTQIYLSPFEWNGVSAFDPLDIADKIGTPDPLVSLVVNNAQLWLIGSMGTEVWYNAGGSDFPFARVSSVLIQHGTCAQDSVCQADVAVYWLEQNAQGSRIFIKGIGYEAKRISTHAIETVWQTYATVSDALAFTYQINGHTFVHLTFPTADATWIYDEASGFWAEATWIDEDGIEHRHRANAVGAAYGNIYCGDWATGFLLQMDPEFYQDIDQPIVYRRGFPHIVNGGKRIGVDQFTLDAVPGQAVGLSVDQAPEVFLRWSLDRGVSFGNPVAASIGSTGQTDVWAAWWQLGEGRDFVFEVFWAFPYFSAIMGAGIDYEALDS